MVLYLLLRNRDDLKCLPKGVLSRAVAIQPNDQLTSSTVFLKQIFDAKLCKSESYKIGIVIVEKEVMSPNRSEVLTSILELSQTHKLEVFHNTRWYSAAPKHLKGLLSFTELTFKVNGTCLIDVWIAAYGIQKPAIHDHVGVSIDIDQQGITTEQTSSIMSTLNLGKLAPKYEEFISKAFTALTVSPSTKEHSRTPSTLHSIAQWGKPPQPQTQILRLDSKKSDQAISEQQYSQVSASGNNSLQAKLNEDLKIKIKAREEVCRSLFLSNKVLKSQLEKTENQLSSAKKLLDAADHSESRSKSYQEKEAALLSNKQSVQIEIIPKPATSKALFDNFLVGSPSRQSSITGFSVRAPKSMIKETQTTDRISEAKESKQASLYLNPLALELGTFGDLKQVLPVKKLSNRDKSVQTSSENPQDLSVRRLTTQMIVPMRAGLAFHAPKEKRAEIHKVMAKKMPTGVRNDLSGYFATPDCSKRSIRVESGAKEHRTSETTSPQINTKYLPFRRNSDRIVKPCFNSDLRASGDWRRSTMDDIHRTLLEMDLKFLQEESRLNTTGLVTFLASNYNKANKTSSIHNNLDPCSKASQPTPVEDRSVKNLSGQALLRNFLSRDYPRPSSTKPSRASAFGASQQNCSRGSANTGWHAKSGQECHALSSAGKLFGRGQTNSGEQASSPLEEFQQERDFFMLSQMQTRMDQWNSFHRNRLHN